MSGQCLSSSVGGRALTPPTRRSLGEPLPHQLADRPQDRPDAINLYPYSCMLYGTMGNYPVFRRVMPHIRGGFLRVTNQFAEGLNPLDLHALSTLPAFTLSQDQTLNKEVVCC